MKKLSRKKLIHDELEKLYVQKKLNRPNVVALAKDPKNPLHKEIFYCSNEKAAYQHRLEIAGGLIRWFETVYVVQQVEITLPEYSKHPFKPIYVKVPDLKNDKESAREFMRGELKMAKGYVERCHKFALVLGLQPRIKKILEEMEGTLNQLVA